MLNDVRGHTLHQVRKVLITGSTGFIGTHLERRLVKKGVSTIGLSRTNGFDILGDRLPLEDIDHVYHVAGLTSVPQSWSDPASYFEANTYGTVRVLDQCRAAGVSLTYVSGYVYGTPASVPISETMETRPTNPYSFSKLAGEAACRFFGDVFGVSVRILRLFNVYGPGQSDTFLIPTIMRQVLDPRVTEIEVLDLQPRRDYVHVEDVVDILLRAPLLATGSIYNVGSGTSRSVKDVITTCLACAGISKPYREEGRRRGNEVLDVVADISAIERACGWRPKISFERGILSVLQSLKP
jgi:nucleoside-diphosphate-sugar epimerase